MCCDWVGGLHNVCPAQQCCGCINVASINSGVLGPFTPVDPRADLSSNWEGRCRPLPTLNYLTFDLEPPGKKNLLQSDWTDSLGTKK